MNPEQRLERITSELRHLDAELGELRVALAKRDEQIKALTQRVAESGGAVEHEVEGADTMRVTRQQVILAKAKADHGSIDAEKLAEKLHERDKDVKKLEALLNAKTLEQRKSSEQVTALTAALEKVGRSGRHRDLIASAVRYYFATPLFARFGELLAGAIELDGQLAGPDGRTLGASGLIDETSSPLGGLSLGAKPIAIKERRLVLEERYRTLFSTWLRHAAEHQLTSQLDVMTRSLAEGLVADVRGASAKPAPG